MSDSLSRFTQPRAATSLTAEDEETLLDEGPSSEFDPAATIADGDEDDDSAALSYEGLFNDAEDWDVPFFLSAPPPLPFGRHFSDRSLFL